MTESRDARTVGDGSDARWYLAGYHAALSAVTALEDARLAPLREALAVLDDTDLFYPYRHDRRMAVIAAARALCLPEEKETT